MYNILDHFSTLIFFHPFPIPPLLYFFKATAGQLLTHSILIKWSKLINVIANQNHDLVTQAGQPLTVSKSYKTDESPPPKLYIVWIYNLQLVKTKNTKITFSNK